MKAIIGLGNPGEKYIQTRHNVGFEVLDALAATRYVSFKRSWRLRALSGKMQVSGGEVLLVKPQEYMNCSGQTLVRLKRRGIAPAEMLVVVDDVSLEPGILRIRERGSAGGHNGLKSVIQDLGTEAFPRIRIGVGAKPAGLEMTDHVLGKFLPEERKMVDRVVIDAVEVVQFAVEEGMVAAMNRFNVRNRANETCEGE